MADNIRVDCTHPNTTHMHGTDNAYTKDRCRCTQCRKAHRDYASNLRRQKAYGRYSAGITTVDKARGHITKLRAAGIVLERIRELSGVGLDTIKKIATASPRSPKHIRISTEAAILSVKPDIRNARPWSEIPPHGTARRLQALVAIGWTQRDLAEMLGIAKAQLWRHLHGYGLVTAATALRVSDLYERMWNTRPNPSTPDGRRAATRAKNRAAKNGWQPPMFWDDDEIDKPRVTSAPRALKRDSTIADVELLAAYGHTRREISTKLGYAGPEGMTRLLERAGRTDLIELIRNNEARSAVAA